MTVVKKPLDEMLSEIRFQKLESYEIFIPEAIPRARNSMYHILPGFSPMHRLCRA